jgi:hypothetical protein
LPGFVVHSVRAGLVIARTGPRTHRIDVGVANLANTLYAEFANVSFFRPEPGRRVFLTYGVAF